MEVSIPIQFARIVNLTSYCITLQSTHLRIGTAGCALAARLSEEKSIRVLLLEAGRRSVNIIQSSVRYLKKPLILGNASGTVVPATRTPAGFLQVLRTDDCFNFTTEPQSETVKGKSYYWPRGMCQVIFSGRPESLC